MPNQNLAHCAPLITPSMPKPSTLCTPHNTPHTLRPPLNTLLHPSYSCTPHTPAPLILMHPSYSCTPHTHAPLILMHPSYSCTPHTHAPLILMHPSYTRPPLIHPPPPPPIHPHPATGWQAGRHCTSSMGDTVRVPCTPQYVPHKVTSELKNELLHLHNL